MIIWGGAIFPSFFNTGARYNPATDSWTATSTTNPPSARYDHTAVWTGSEMIVWGGADAASAFNTGGRYDPATDSWTTTGIGSSPAAQRYQHTAVRSGSEMIVWGEPIASAISTPAGDTIRAQIVG
jgi:N-acetylneuraminic acid mutarotase